MSSVVPTGAVASVGARRLPAHRASSAGRRSVIARSGKRAGRGSKISRESLIVSAEKKRDKAYGYAYGHKYGGGYGDGRVGDNKGGVPMSRARFLMLCRLASFADKK